MSKYDDLHEGHGLIFGLAALAVGALIGLAFAPESGKRNRKRAQDWMNNMKSDLRSKVRENRDMTQEKYNQTVDELSKHYSKFRDISQEELHDFVRDLKLRWDRIKYKWETRDTKNTPDESSYYYNDPYEDEDLF
jgi:gas vesicle protein